MAKIVIWKNMKESDWRNGELAEKTILETELRHCLADSHKSPVTDVNAGEIICSDCGIVLEERAVDRNNDSKTFTKEDYLNTARNGPPTKISISDMSSSSIISKKNFDAVGKKMHSNNIRHFSRMRFWDSRSKSNNKEQNLVKAFTVLDAYSNKLNMPENAKEHAAYIYRKAVDKKIIRGNSIPSMMAASVYASCKQLGIPRSVDEISKITNINRKKLLRSYKRLVKKLEIKVDSTGINYVSKISSSLSVSEKTSRLANKILHDAKQEKIHVGKNPIGVTAASIYLSAINHGEHVPIARIARKTNISTVTIRKIIKMLRPFAAKYIKSIDIGA